MQLLITLKPSGRPSDQQDDLALRRGFQQTLQKWLSAGRLIASGTFADAPGGFLIIEADSAEGLDALLSSGMVEHFYVSVNPLAPVERLVEHLQLWDDAQMYL